MPWACPHAVVRASGVQRAVARSSFAAEAAARPVPLKRQSTRQFTDTCRVAGLLADSRTARGMPWECPHAVVRVSGVQRAVARLSSAAEAAARPVPLKRQSVRQFTDTCRVAGLPADSRTATRVILTVPRALLVAG